MPQPVIDAIFGHVQLEARLGGYEAADAMAEECQQVYQDIAQLIGARPEEIALCENATVAWDQAFYALQFQAGQRILTSQAEYAANYVAFLQRAKRDGVVIDVIPHDATGAVDVSALEYMIDERVRLIAVTWIPSNGGLVNPARAIGAVARKYGILYLLDACQAVGQMMVDVQALNCDMQSATGRKFLRGPRGTGFLYVRGSLLNELEPVTIDHFAAPWVARDQYRLRNDARRFETWENAYALRLGLRAAVRYALNLGLDAIRSRSWHLADSLRHDLASIDGVKIMDSGADRCAIVSFIVSGKDPLQFKAELRDQGINVSTSEPSSTLLDAEDRDLPILMRASPHYYNTEGELDRFLEAVHDGMK